MSNTKLAKIIEKKRKGDSLTREDISFFINAVVLSMQEKQNKFETADRCQIGAMLMAIYLKGLNPFETVELTRQMKNSGEIFEWSDEFKDLMVDKHSTGGVGDKVSLILAPTLAALGLKVPMISGRSLSHTGGTLDKLESIPGYRVQLSTEEIKKAIKTVGCCIAGQTADCVPADKILYNCRELTSTVDYSPLIIASIASKKLSEGLNSIVYDVKFGKGAVIKSKQDALELAKSLVDASKDINAAALFTSMDAPLGRSIGNSLEVLEAVECLKGEGPDDVLQVVTALGLELLHLSRKMNKEEGLKLISRVIQKGDALKIFHDMIIFHGVSEKVAYELCYGDPSKVLKKTSYVTDISYCGDEGFIKEMDSLRLAELWKEEDYSSQNHPGVGITLLKTVGDKISKGDIWLKFHHERKIESSSLEKDLSSLITVASKKVERKLIEKRIFYSGESVIVEDC